MYKDWQKICTIIYFFSTNQCLKQDNIFKIMISATDLRHDLHFLAAPSISFSNARVHVNQNADKFVVSVYFYSLIGYVYNLWHLRLGYPSYETLTQNKSFLLLLLSTKIYCLVMCFHAKQRRFSFPFVYHFQRLFRFSTHGYLSTLFHSSDVCV